MSKPLIPFLYDELRLPEMLKFIGVVLRRAVVPIFRMKDRLVLAYEWETPSSESADEKLRRADGSLMLDTVNSMKMHEFIVEHVPFRRIIGTPPVPTPISPPKSLSTSFMEGRHHWLFRDLTGMITTPTLREDGTLLAVEGYDTKSGLYLNMMGVNYPTIPNRPTQEEARAALTALKEPFEEVPFVKETIDFDEVSPSLSVALSAILTGLIRRTLRSAPLHGFDAAEAGSGKGLCCSVVTNIVTGTDATAITFGDDEHEMKKLLFSALLANDQVIVFDNLTRPLEGAALNTVLTEAAWEERILGESRTAIVPTNALFLASGNNLQINGDMHRRIIAARIDAGENPEVRTFKRPKLLDWVRNNRARLVVAGLTVLRAYEVAGRPDQKIPEYGSFEEWSQRVRNALVWLGEADPCLTRARFKESDPEREALGGVLTALFPISDGAWKKCKDVVSEIDTGPAIADALNGAQIACNPKALGIYLSRHNGRTVDGLRLDTAKDKHAKVLTFRITQGD
jgi:hypothetical protein